MMEYYYDLIKNFAFTGTVGVFTYWIPLALCAIGYSVKTFKQIRYIKEYNHKTSGYYVEDLTVGTLVWRLFLTVTPIVNVLALSFSLADDMIRQVFNWLGALLNIKLVKKST